MAHAWLHSPKLIPAGHFHPAICMDCGADNTRDDHSECPGKLPTCSSCHCTVTRCRCSNGHAVRSRCGQLGGRPRRYDLSGFSLGQAVTIPWRVDFRGDRLRNQEAVHQAVRREEKRLGQRFARVAAPTGLVVTRIQ